MENNLPQGWVECSLGEILTAKKGKKPASVINEPKAGYVPYILIDEMEGKPVRAYTNDPKVSIIDESEVLLVWDGSIGKCGSGLKGAIGSTLVGLKALDKIQTKFLEYTIKQQNNFIKETSTGTGLQHINKDFFEICRIPLPPLAEQHRIVAKLDAIMQKVENNKQHLDKIPKLLKRFRQSVLAAAVSGKLTEDWRKKNYIVEEWENKTLLDVIKEKPKNGYSAKPVNYKTPFRVLTLTATTSGKFKSEHFKFFDEKINFDSPFWIQPNDILIQRGNTIEYVGVSAIYDGEPNKFIYPDLMMRVRANNNILTTYLYYVLSDENSRKYLRERATGTAGNMPKINQPILISLPIELPQKKEQKEIVRRVEQLFAFADKVEARYTKAKAMLDKLPQSILAKAFRGELVPQNPNDEPASVLLERIKAEKEKLAEKRNLRKKI